MTKIATNTAAKLSVAFVTVAMIFTMFVPAQAQTTDDLAAQIAALLEQIAQLEAQIGGGSTTGAGTCVAIMAPLTIGSRGADVTALQNFLINAGEVIPAGATGYFGSQTQAAVASWQAANGVSPAVGYYGPITKAAIEAACVPSAPVDGGDDMDDEDDMDEDESGLGDGEGDIDSVTEVSADESNVEEGQLGGVLAFDVEIDGDVMIDRMDFYMEVDDSSSASDDLDDYFTAFSLWVDGDMVAEMDVDEADEEDDASEVTNGGTTDDEFRVRFSGLDLVFEDGDEPEFQFAVEVDDSLDSGDLAADWYVALISDGIRFVDGQGFTGEAPTSAVEDSFGFDAEEVAELDISESSDSPDETTLEVDTNDESQEYDVFVIEVEEENGVDVTIDEMTFTASTTNTDVTTTIDEAILYADGSEVSTDSPTAAGVLNFEDVDTDIDADGSVEFTVALIFKELDGSDFNEGDEVFVTFTSMDDVEDENGNDEGDMTITGTPTSATHTLRSEGIALTLDSKSANKDAASFSGDFDTGTFTFEIEVEAFGEDFYMDEDEANVSYTLLVNGDAAAAASSTASLTIADADDASVADYKISEGENNVATLTFTVETADDVSGSTRVRIDSVSYSEDDDAVEELTELATPATDWRTTSLILN